MKYLKVISIGLCLAISQLQVFSQKVITEGTLIYDVAIQTGDPKNQSLIKATTTVYLKGNNSRTDMVSALGSESTIHNAKLGSTAILKEFSGQKLMITLTKQNWEAKNKLYRNVTFEVTNDTKTIAGYSCKKAIAKMENGKTFIVYYNPEMVTANKEYDITFSKLPGLAMQYEIEADKMKLSYTISKISLDPVPLSKFDFPSAGYRVMTYEENQQIKKGK